MRELPGGETTARAFLHALNAVRKEAELQEVREIMAVGQLPMEGSNYAARLRRIITLADNLK